MNKWFNIRGKKGLAATFIVSSTLTLIAFVLISGSVMRFMEKAEGAEAEVLCQQSLALRANTMISMDWVAGSNTELKMVPPMCQTLEKKLSGTEEEISEEFAYLSSKCWWMFGEGRYEELLRDVDTELMWGFFSNDKLENDCFMCYTVMIDEDEIGENNLIPSTDLLNVQHNTSHRIYSNITYLEYIQSYGGPGRVAILTDIEPNNVYAVSYLVKNAPEDSALWKSYIKTVGGFVAAQAGVGLIIVGGVCFAGSVGLATPVCGTAAGVGLALIGVGGAALGIGGISVVSGVHEASIELAKEELYQNERDTSMIIIDTLESAQEQCFQGDLAGE
jgi:hypothetical protein